MLDLPAKIAFAVVLLTACGGSPKPAPSNATVPSATCADAAANNARVITAMGEAQGQDMSQYAAAGRDVYAERCPADHWSQDVIDCAAAAPTADDIIACVERLTPEQHQAMEDAFAAKMGASAG